MTQPTLCGLEVTAEFIGDQTLVTAIVTAMDEDGTLAEYTVREAATDADISPLGCFEHDGIRWLVTGKTPIASPPQRPTWNWQLVETAPYETPVLTYWPGDMGAKPEYLINSRNSGTMLGKRDNWWNSRLDRQPTLWTPIIGPKDAS